MHISGGHKDKSVTHSGDCEVCPPNMCCSEKAHSEHKEKKRGGGEDIPSHDFNYSYTVIILFVNSFAGSFALFSSWK